MAPSFSSVRTAVGSLRGLIALVAIGSTVAACSGSVTASPSGVTAATEASHEHSSSNPTVITSPSAGRSTTAAASPGAEWSLVALGDSIVSEGYPQLFASLVEARTGKSVAVITLADGSNTTATVLASLRDSGTVREAVKNADIVTISVGGNDADPFANYPPGTCRPGGKASTCLARYAPDLSVQYDAMLTEIEKLRAGKPTLVRPTTDYNPFIGWDASPTKTFGLDFYRQVADAETALVCDLAVKHGLVCADIYHAFNGPNGIEDAAPFLATDHAHPSTAGSQRIAEVLLSPGLAPLR